MHTDGGFYTDDDIDQRNYELDAAGADDTEGDERPMTRADALREAAHQIGGAKGRELLARADAIEQGAV